MNLKKVLALTVICLSVNVASFAQLWKEESPAQNAGYLSRNAATLPEKARFYSLDAMQLKTKVQSARKFDQSLPATTELTLPAADGSFVDAALYESSILSRELEGIIPGVRTYMLVDKASGTGMGRITVAANAISGILFTEKGTVYINPVNEKANRTHIVYYAKEVRVPQNVTCGVNESTGAVLQPAQGARLNVGDGQLRTYRLAVSATGEYYAWAGSSLANALTYITICINNVNAIYERDAAIHFNLVTNNNIIYTDASADPYTASVSPTGTTLSENDNATDANLGAPYDIGIVFNNAWSGGLAQLSSVCTTSKGRAAAGITFGSGANPTAGPQGPIFDGTVAHEIGHQFSATHTMIASNGGCSGNVTPASAWEPGGGSTLMAYAGTCTGNFYQLNSDLYFHGGNLAQIASFATGGGNACAVNTLLSNTAPAVSVAASTYTIPVSTPFFLNASASDPNGNGLTYTWEEMDAAAATASTPSASATSGPNFRSYAPSSSSLRYFPNMAALVAGTLPTYEVLPSVGRTMNFRVTVRDNASGGGANTQTDVSVVTNASGGPFAVTSQIAPVSLTANGSNTLTVTWNVAGTAGAPFNVTNVDILFSADGGSNFNYTLLSSTANDGTQTIIVPNIPTSTGRIMVRAVGNIFFNINQANISIASGCAAEGALLSPASTVYAAPGSSALNLAIAPTFGSTILPTSGATLQSGDGVSSLSMNYLAFGSCVNFNGNSYTYDAYTFQVNIAGNYTFTKSGGNYCMNLYSGPFTPGAPCTNFMGSTFTYINDSTISGSNNLTAALLPGVQYTLTAGTFNATTPHMPFAYTLSLSSAPPGGNVYTGYPNPGGSFSYYYVIVSNASNNIITISATPDLRNSSTFPPGSYTVHGFSYLTSDFNAGVLNGYIGGPLSTLSNDLLNAPGTHCGNLSKNTVPVNILLILPVDLLPLTAVREDQKVRLYWSTETETGSRDFVIERSADGRAFLPVKSVPAAINSQSRINYAEYDENPLAGANYYRVRANSIDATFKYTNVALVKSNTPGLDIHSYPNPVRDKAILEIIAPQRGSGTLEIINTNGVVVNRERLAWQKGLNVESVDMRRMVSGVYYIKVSSDDGITTIRMVKL